MSLGMNKDEIDLSVLIEDRKCGACPAQLPGEPQINRNSTCGELDALRRKLSGNAAPRLNRGQR
jgi:hypothetical protein